MTLGGAQAGLSWRPVLHGREGYRRVFEGFDLEGLASWTDEDQATALLDEGIICNRAKVASTVGNAQATLAAIEEHGSLGAYLWSFVGGETQVNAVGSMGEIPAETDGSKAMSKALKQAEFRFVGPLLRVHAGDRNCYDCPDQDSYTHAGGHIHADSFSGTHARSDLARPTVDPDP